MTMIRTIVAPTQLPVSVPEFQSHAVVVNETDAFIDALLRVATEEAENITKKVFVSRTLEYVTNGFLGVIALPTCPVQSITSITYTDPDDAEQTVSAATYRLYDNYENPYVGLLPGETWPATLDVPDAVKVRFVAGYSYIDEIPFVVRHAILVRAQDLNETRESIVIGVNHSIVGSVTMKKLLELNISYK